MSYASRPHDHGDEGESSQIILQKGQLHLDAVLKGVGFRDAFEQAPVILAESFGIRVQRHLAQGCRISRDIADRAAGKPHPVIRTHEDDFLKRGVFKNPCGMGRGPSGIDVSGMGQDQGFEG